MRMGFAMLAHGLVMRCRLKSLFCGLTVGILGSVGMLHLAVNRTFGCGSTLMRCYITQLGEFNGPVFYRVKTSCSLENGV